MQVEAYLSFFARVEKNPQVLSALGVLLAALEEGHVCLTLTYLAQKGEITLEKLEEIVELSPLVGKAGEFRPFIIDQDRLYVARFWFEEVEVAKYLIKKKEETVAVDLRLAGQVLTKLFTNKIEREPDWQKLAAALAMIQPLTIITGGPGTGKTTTLTKLLIAILANTPTENLNQRFPIIKLAAPTGKAAARMQEAIQVAKARLSPDFAALLPYIPDEASTLHRLLGINALAKQNLPHTLLLDILVIDEASMIDLSMMHRIVASLPSHARLILLGDQDQLASVEPGSVFSSLSQTQGYTPWMGEQLKQMTGISLPLSKPTSYLSDTVIHLQQSYRFSSDSGIGALALATNEGDISQAKAILEANYADVVWSNDKTSALSKMIEGYQPYFELIRDLKIPIQAVFNAWEAFRVLTPLREGIEGSQLLNQRISHAYEDGASKGEWYTGRAILITENHPSQGLYNGDIGLTRIVEGKVYVYFMNEKKEVRHFTPARLPRFEMAFVMTVHKSQGSEFEHVYCFVPDIINMVMGRALFYTAVTRAKKKLTICGKMEVIEAMLAQSAPRESGLAQRLYLSETILL